jgi:hypothetical protein
MMLIVLLLCANTARTHPSLKCIILIAGGSKPYMKWNGETMLDHSWISLLNVFETWVLGSLYVYMHKKTGKQRKLKVGKREY